LLRSGGDGGVGLDGVDPGARPYAPGTCCCCCCCSGAPPIFCCCCRSRWTRGGHRQTLFVFARQRFTGVASLPAPPCVPSILRSKILSPCVLDLASLSAEPGPPPLVRRPHPALMPPQVPPSASPGGEKRMSNGSQNLDVDLLLLAWSTVGMSDGPNNLQTDNSAATEA
jgi:hypothetical protein